MQNQDRRATGVKRVRVQTLVEICGRVPEVPAFEAQSIEVSGRGMHVRTRYLPPVGAPLVLRFEEAGRQILVEGEVAWSDDHDSGGEFGIRFTALDSGSVDALKHLCGIHTDQNTQRNEAEAGRSEEPDPEAYAQAPSSASRARKATGTRVRLHIDGLGSPMKAQVRKARSRSMTVGSKLEFLKIGRHLDIEDLDDGDRCGAAIETVDVVIDPQSQVPQLVVSLAYDQPFEDTTPEPSVVNAQRSERGPRAAAELASAEFGLEEDQDAFGPATRATGTPERATSQAASYEDEDLDDEPDFDSDYDDGVSAEYDEGAEPNAFQTKFGQAASQAGQIAKNTGEALKHVGLGAATRVGGWLKQARNKRGAASSGEAGGPPTRKQSRRTAAPPSGVMSAGGRQLRPQSGRRPGSTSGQASTRRPSVTADAIQPKSKKLKRYGAVAGAAVLLTTVAVLAMRKPAPVPGGDEALSKSVAAADVQLGPTDDVTNVDEQGNPVAASGTPDLNPGGKTTADGISADVPLFGPTPMATTEAAQVDEEAPSASLDEPVDDTPPVEDESWGDKGQAPAGGAEKPAKAANVNPSSVAPWGRGAVSRPTIHRIRLDGPGGAIQGAISPTGFAVVIPGRKVMESGAGVSKRDKRIARVKTSNGKSGAQISFQFKDGIPGYRVRLRKDFVEFLISEPKKGGALAKR